MAQEHPHRRGADRTRRERLSDADQAPVEGGSNRDWWPNAVNLKILQKNPPAIDPTDEGYDYREAVKTPRLRGVRA